ncbi:hypothetical protein [Frankia sp. AgKG'84/4]|uniref:hypothetical protein n=1 Tax=Frankia sp. AgKG'84/4 TaxID=573490 RepID=UPI00200CD280|nr:hypothetical protein [Frankia sp. AgKG'84/4]MCL9794713.1 hypothetical protein [Frankia sp. AgKG'84/4]
MTSARTLLDRARIERAVWTMDTRLADLPRRSRINKRRELRDNLRLAAADVGAGRAVHQLGDLRTLADDYLAAEYGEHKRRPSWTVAALTILLVEVVMTLLVHVGRSAFHAGITATNPQATGVYRWHGIRYLVSDETFTYTHGAHTSVGGAWTPLVYMIMLGGAVVTGRLWRLNAAWRRQRRRATLSATDNATGGEA